MNGYFRALAVDYDGTLTTTRRPDDAVLQRLQDARSDGLTLALVTGRIRAELIDDFPDVEAFFDLLVLENGAVLSRSGVVRDLASPVDVRLGLALAHRDVPVRQGRVLLACDAVHAETALAEITRLGLEVQIVRNREALMILPAGVTKGTGLREGLAEVGISWHSTLAVGDAENDHSLLEACEVGVAVANGVESLREQADVVLDEPDGRGVLGLLDGALLGGQKRIHPRRWQIELGRDPADRPIRIPGSQLNVLVTGASGAGKSYAAGLLVERLIDLRYTTLVLDPTGEHVALGRLRGAISFGGRGDPLPHAARLPELLSHRFGTIILDLTMLPGPARHTYIGEVSRLVADHRRRTGLPHWIVIEEAHVLAGQGGAAQDLVAPGVTGNVLVTYHPRDLCVAALQHLDVMVLVVGGEGDAGRELSDQLAGLPAFDSSPLQEGMGPGPPGRAILVSPGTTPRRFTLGPRRSGHVRHHHKYTDAELPHHLRFFFGSAEGRPGPVAANLTQFRHAVEAVDEGVLRAHVRRHDFSRWIDDVLSDGPLAQAVAEIESGLRDADDLHEARGRLVDLVGSRYALGGPAEVTHGTGT